MSSHTGNTPTKITLSYPERMHFEAVALRATASQRDAFRSRIVLLAARGFNNTQIGQRLSCTRKTARKWRNRYAKSGRAGLADKPRPGRPRIYDEATRALVTAIACELPADRGLPLSRFSSADIHAEALQELDSCPARSTIAAWLKQAAIRPWAVTSWVTPRDPQFKQKAARVCDLYTGMCEDEPLTEGDVIICADEKTGIQARSQRKTPPGPGKSVRLEHHYDRNGTTIYQAAFIAGSGNVSGHCVKENTRANFETLVEKVMADPICQNADRVFWIMDIFDSDPWFMPGSTNDEKEQVRQTPVKMCRLGWTGDMELWDLAFHRYSDGRYQPSIDFDGSGRSAPETCFDCAAQVYLR